MPSSLLLARRRVALLAVSCAAVAIPVAGCGSSSSNSSAGAPGTDPAALLPASVPVYVEAQVRPTGELAANAKTVAGKILRTTDPGGKIVGLIDAAAKKKGGSYEKDVEPWLGQRAGIAVTGVRGGGGKDVDVVGAIASKDDDAAKAFLEQYVKGGTRTYRDVEYRYDSGDDLAAAVVDHAVLVGTERGFKSALDARSGTSLESAGAFKKARGTVGTDGLGFAYVDPSRFFDLALGAANGSGSLKGSNAQSLQAFKGLLTGSGLQSVAASLDVTSNALRIDAAAIGLKQGGGSSSGAGAGDSAAAAASAPAGAWLSIGLGDVGGTFKSSLSTLGSAGATGGIDPATLMAQLKAQLGIDINKDLLAWMGKADLFVKGTTMSDLGGALVVTSKDPAASKAAIPKLKRLLSGLNVKTADLSGPGTGGATGFTVAVGGPVAGGIKVAAKDDKFVVAYGASALKDALDGSDKLGDSDPYKTAAGLLEGAKPSLFLDTPQVVKLIGSVAGSNQDFAKAKPTLDAFGPAAAGTVREGDVTHLKAAVSVP
ncbi:MAG TPA: DUF3352 domain-containing protein [Baekduia sp.]|uniref:DUF3352 domain-containing protein n=1 Tax=Baekduia sp. TaxID=2600305 RepID=UPI002D781B13|nr:DUF3352 domain-containing protein [Baekduia sp.]HET6505540.1 DUF3352 domain-containing protein [Baekduia sp.]